MIYFCLFHPQTRFSTHKATGNVRVYSKALYIYTLVDNIVNFLHNENVQRVFPRRDHSFSGIFWSSHSYNLFKAGDRCRPQKHVNMCEGSNTLAWIFYTAIPEGNDILSLSGGQSHSILNKTCCLQVI